LLTSVSRSICVSRGVGLLRVADLLALAGTGPKIKSVDAPCPRVGCRHIVKTRSTPGISIEYVDPLVLAQEVVSFAVLAQVTKLKPQVRGRVGF